MSHPSATSCDVIIAGGGIVGLATAMALQDRQGLDVVVLEAESELAPHQSGHNSGVIHAGLYYVTGSLKHRLCVAGREAMYRFCGSEAPTPIPHERCGKLVVAVEERELPLLARLEERARANGVEIERLDADSITRHEPNVRGVAAMRVADTGVVDFAVVTRAYAEVVRSRGGDVRTGAPVLATHRDGTWIEVETTGGRVRGRTLVCCCGLQADRVARLDRVDPGVRLMPFRGEYGKLSDRGAGLVRHLVYPVPDPSLPFLGIHLTRMIGGEVEVGPSAVMSMARHGYRRGSFSLRDVLEIIGYRGTWRMARAHWRSGVLEWRRSVGSRLMLHAAQRLVPDLTQDDLLPGRTGIRAQAVTPEGGLLDDFHVVRGDRSVHVINAPSPAATASIAIGRHVAELATNPQGA